MEVNIKTLFNLLKQLLFLDWLSLNYKKSEYHSIAVSVKTYQGVSFSILAVAAPSNHLTA